MTRLFEVWKNGLLYSKYALVWWVVMPFLLLLVTAIIEKRIDKNSGGNEVES